MKQYLFLGAALLLAFSCAKEPEISGVDWDTWRADRYGCEEQRQQFIDTILAQKEAIKGIHEDEIHALFGRPDRKDLDQRMKKMNYYFLAPGEKCEDAKGEFLPRSLKIEFESFGRVKTVIVQ